MLHANPQLVAPALVAGTGSVLVASLLMCLFAYDLGKQQRMGQGLGWARFSVGELNEAPGFWLCIGLALVVCVSEPADGKSPSLLSINPAFHIKVNKYFSK